MSRLRLDVTALHAVVHGATAVRANCTQPWTFLYAQERPNARTRVQERRQAQAVVSVIHMPQAQGPSWGPPRPATALATY